MGSVLFSLAYTVVFIVVFVDLLSRGKGDSQQAQKYDQGSTLLMAAATVGSLALLPFFAAAPLLAVQSPFFVWTGVSLEAVGILLRVWARATLGRYYTLTLKTTSKQSLVDWGPYRRVRHPGYLGYLLMWIGIGAVSTSVIAVAAVFVLTGSAYVYRINNEEELLRAALGESYEEYAKRTDRLVPFIY